jgi:hypothetical protein
LAAWLAVVNFIGNDVKRKSNFGENPFHALR